MTAKDGKPCKRCGTREWDKWGNCKECGRGSARRWARANPDRAAENARRWQSANPDKKAEQDRRWKQANPDKTTDHKRRYRQANPDKAAEATRQWRQANPEKVNAIHHRRRTRKTQAGGSYTAAEWKALVAQYDGHCCYPGCSRTDLHADHVKPVSKGGTSNIGNIQPLCGYHNQSKGAKTIDYRTKSGIKRWIQKKLFG